MDAPAVARLAPELDFRVHPPEGSGRYPSQSSTFFARLRNFKKPPPDSRADITRSQIRELDEPGPRKTRNPCRTDD